MNSTIAFTLLSMFFFILCIIYFVKGRRLRNVCTEKVIATIVEIEHRLNDRKFEYVPIYEYRINDVIYLQYGQPTKAKNKYQVGDESFVLYNPKKPRECLVEGKNEANKASLIFLFLGTLFAVFAIFIK